MEIVINKKIATKQQIQDIALDISWAKIVRKYFGQSDSWIYDEIDDANNGFTETEKDTFRGALYNLAERIRKTADNFK